MAVCGAALTLAVSELARSDRFYRQILGAIPEPGEPGTCPWYRLGPLRVTLLPNADRRSASSFPEHAMAMLWLEVDDLDALHRHCLQHAVPVIQSPDGASMIIEDPDGLVIELWQHEAPEPRTPG